LLGTFYANAQWSGQPAFQRIDPFLDVYFHLVPLHRPYTVEWTGSLEITQPGLYRLGLRAVQEAQLFLDDQLLVTTLVPNEYYDAAITLQPGQHELMIRYLDSTDRSRIHLTWIPPSGQFGPIPSEHLWPPLGRYPLPVPTSTRTAVQTKPVLLTWLATLGSPGSEPGRFLEPRDVALLADGSLVIADTGNRRVQIIDPRGAPLELIQGDPFPFEEPLAVAVNSQNEILVLDSTLQWVYRYSAAGQFLGRFGGPTTYLFHPRGLTVFADDTIALADTGSARIVLFDAAGNQAGIIGGLGSGPGQFNEPTDVLRDEQGTFFVVEAENSRIQRVDANGNPLLQWAIPPAYAYDGPHLASGPDGSIFVTESESSSLLRYAPDGALLDQWQTIGPVTLAAPVGIYFDTATNRLYITDVSSHQLHVFTVQTVEG
jgi:sugar lactone lactonase YvrE